MADVKISELPETTTPSGSDILPVVIDPAGTPTNKKTKISSLISNNSASGSEIDTGTDNTKIATPKGIADSSLVFTDKTQTLTNKTLTSPTINTKILGSARASAQEIYEGTSDIKIITPLGLKDARGMFPRVRVYQTSDQSIPNTTNTFIQFHAEDFDIGNMFDASVDNTKLVVPSDGGGYYLVGGTLLLRDSSTAGRILQLKKNGTIIADVRMGHDGQGRWSAVAVAFIYATAGDYFQMFFYQSSGGTLTTNSGATFFWAVRLF